MTNVAHFVTPTGLISIFNEYERESLRSRMIGPLMPHIQQLKTVALDGRECIPVNWSTGKGGLIAFLLGRIVGTKEVLWSKIQRMQSHRIHLIIMSFGISSDRKWLLRASLWSGGPAILCTDWKSDIKEADVKQRNCRAVRIATKHLCMWLKGMKKPSERRLRSSMPHTSADGMAFRLRMIQCIHHERARVQWNRIYITYRFVVVWKL